VVALSILVYAASWGGGLVWDDHFLLDGSAIGGGKSLWNCFTVPFLAHYFRPIVSLDFFFERRLFGYNPIGYRLISTLLHAAATGVLLGLLRDAFGSRRAALCGGLVFAVHPAQVGAVAWIGGRTDALCILWVALLARCLVIAARTPARRGPMLAWSVLWYTLAIFTKEQTLALLPLVPLAFKCWQPRDGVDRPHEKWVFLAPFVAVTILFVVLGWSLGMPRPQPLPGTLANQAAQAGRIMAYYALILLVPTPRLMHLLSLGPFERAGFSAVLLGYGALAVALWLLWRLVRRDRPSAWFLLLSLLSLAPVSGVVPLPFLLVAPYRAAIACIGVSALLGRAAAWALARKRDATGAKALAVFGIAAVAAYTALTIWGAIQWRDEVSLFERIVRADPDAVVPPYVLGYMYTARSNPAAAAREFEATLRNIFGSDAWKDRDRALAALRDDSAVLARARQNQGMDAPPRLWVASVYNDLAKVYLNEGQTVAALATYQIGEAIDPKNPDIISGIGFCQAAFGHVDEAVRRMRQALAIDPNHAYSHEWLGRHYTQAGDWEKAVKELEAWSKAAPDSADARTMLQDARAQLERRRALESGRLFGPG
jgi:tetratricopeptide (TPR) repeat protein